MINLIAKFTPQILYLWHLEGVNCPGQRSRANLKNGRGSFRK